MHRMLWYPFALILSASPLIGAAPAQAQALRTWVSGVGDDANPCSRTAPCKTFAGAISKTAAKGEINCIDPGAFGAVTITKSITISCPDVEAGVLATLNTNGIIINALATDKITLEGLDIEGVGTGGNGVRILSASTVFINRCSIRGFAQNAVTLVGPAGARAFITDSHLYYNDGGVNVQGNAAGVANTAFLDNVTMDRNTTFSLKVASGSSAVISNSTFAGSAASISAVAGANVISYGGNLLRDPGAPTQTLPKQ